MPRFVILEHDHPELHWDLMLEAGNVLRTWRFSAPPGSSIEPSAESSFDHRLIYLTYEGAVSGNRGIVTRWDSGEFDWLRQEDDRVQLCLRGQRMQGLLELLRQATGNWSVLWQPAS